jgi:hypothetical protein
MKGTTDFKLMPKAFKMVNFNQHPYYSSIGVSQLKRDFATHIKQ